MPTKTYDPEKLTPEQNAVIESILKMAEAEASSKPKPKYCIWKPTIGDQYFYYDSAGIVWEGQWDYNWIDNERYDHGNCYRTKEEATFAVERNKVIAELRRFAEEYNDPIDWNRETQKYEILCHHNSGEADIHTTFTYCGQTSNICFSSKEIAQAAINEIGKERLIKYYFGSYKEQE